MSLHFENAALYKKQVNRLFLSAFPKDERPPLFVPHLRHRQGRASFRAIVDGERFVGLALITGTKNVQTLMFFAIEEACRGQGYGGRVLQMLKAEYAHIPFFLCAEPLDDTAPNSRERINRLRFYAHNGFHEVGLMVREGGVDFTVLSPGGNITYEQYREATENFFGKCYFWLLTHLWK